MITPHQMQSAIRKLGERGMHLPADADRRDVAGAIAMVLDVPIPSGAYITEFIWRFLQQGETQPQTREFKEYKPGREWDEVHKRINPNKQFKHSSGRLWNK